MNTLVDGANPTGMQNYWKGNLMRELGDGAYEQRPSAAYGANYDRLVEIKAAYAPTNFFRHNQNIRLKAQSAVAS